MSKTFLFAWFVLILSLAVGCARNDDRYWAGVAKETGERVEK